jgi:hypothetical protein
MVIQLPQSALSGFDDLVRYEDALIEVLAEAHDVDRHDSGLVRSTSSSSPMTPPPP